LILKYFPTEPFTTKDIHKKSVKISVIFRLQGVARNLEFALILKIIVIIKNYRIKDFADMVEFFPYLPNMREKNPLTQ